MKSNRRSFIQKIGVATVALGQAPTAFASAKDIEDPQDKGNDQLLQIGDNIANANTSYGKVRGFVLRGINTFLGIPYGADTSGENRFMPPQKPKAWTDVYPAVWWGNSAPQGTNKRYENKYASFVDHLNFDDESEDCLRLNVWTPGIADGKKRPVMVWVHGGGFANGNAIEQDGYHGENFSRRGNVVFCSLNHRLGTLGYANFAKAGSKFAASGNVGMLDIVAALEWVRDNISNFGGDPGNVTILGQSAGGAKVCVLTAMPAAKGLFHKAVVLSGASIKAEEKDLSEKLGEYVLKEAGLTLSDMDKLQKMPWQEYNAMATKANLKMREEMKLPGGLGAGGFRPVVDGTFLPQHPYSPAASPTVSEIPMIICSLFNEISLSRTNADLEKIQLAEVKQKVKERFGDKTDKIVEAYAKSFPDKKPIEIWSMVISNHRQNAITLADTKSRQNAAVYLAWFGWQPPLFDNRMRSFHNLDICFWFNNTDLMYTHTGGGSRPAKLSMKMADTLLKFMQTGNPNGAGLPTWAKYTSDKGDTMILNDQSELKNDPDREARKTFF